MASSSNSANDDEEFFDEASSALHIPQEVMKAIDQVIYTIKCDSFKLI